MTKKNAILLLTFSILLAPGLAAADSTAAAPPVSQALSSLSCPAAGPGAATLAVTPAELGRAIARSNSPNCCLNFERTCQRICEGVIVEFTCNPESCVAFCVCG